MPKKGEKCGGGAKKFDGARTPSLTKKKKKKKQPDKV